MMSVMIQNILQQVMINNHNARSKVDNQRKEKEKIIEIIIHDLNNPSKCTNCAKCAKCALVDYCV